MIVDLDQKDLKSGVLSLVVALVEIIKETLRHQSLRRMESGSLTEVEINGLGEALMELDAAVEKIKLEIGIAESVKAVRDGLDGAVQDVVDAILNPGRREGRPS